MFRDSSRNLLNQNITVEQANEVKLAFDSGVAMCFKVNKELGAGPRIKIISDILENHLDVMLVKCDLFIDSADPKAFSDMILLVKKETENESFNKMVDEIIIPSGIVSEAIFVGKTNEKNVKKAVRREFANDKPCIVKKANLLVDGDKLVLTIRSYSPKKDK